MTADEIVFIVLYYITAIAGFALYIGLMRRNGLQVLSFSGLAYLVSTVSVIIPAPYIVYGIYFKGFGLCEGWKWDLFSIYLVFAFLFPLSLWVGRYLARPVYIKFRESHSFNLRIIILTLIISCYTFYAFGSFGFEKLPLVNLLINGNFAEAYTYKMELVGLEKINPSVGKWNIITLPYFIILAFYYYLKSEDGKWQTKATFVFLFIIVIFLTNMQLGRDDFAQFLLAFICIKPIIYRKPFLLKFTFLVGIALLFFFLFSYQQDFEKGVLNFVDRIIGQSAFTYIQINFIKQGYLWFEGVNMPFFGSLFDITFKSPSHLAHILFTGGSFEWGSTAGLSYATIYYSFGVLGFVIAFFMSAGIGFIDGCYLNTMYSQNDRNNKYIVSSVYFTLIAIYCVNIITNFYAFFSFPCVFSPSFYLIHIYLFALAGFFNVCVKRNMSALM
ncbi:MAG: hypothetical protein A4E74_01736 [Syntrophus sp. PtaB.Bin075]|nr:MAG: hypothetical protein A4E74_01736 [Syntrophus sp. PtaB.Bin075]